MPDDVFLVLDIGTGSVRAAIVDKSGAILAFASRISAGRSSAPPTGGTARPASFAK
jgi:sugar (pentulose or hexulose) kinase